MRNRLFLIFLVVIILLYETSHVSSDSKNGILSRQKRLLLFEKGFNEIQLIIGIGVPVEIKSNSVVFGWGYRAAYIMPSNLSQLMPMDLNTRRKRSASRWDIYKMLEQIFEMKGLAGKPCTLQSICQASDIPMDKQNGLFDEFFHTLFTPSTTNEDIHHHTDNEYYAAQKLGRIYKGKCRQLFPECEVTLLDIFTQLVPHYTY